jgi:hypothetical protein
MSSSEFCDKLVMNLYVSFSSTLRLTNPNAVVFLLCVNSIFSRFADNLHSPIKLHIFKRWP